jgi:hypothetical protein
VSDAWDFSPSSLYKRIDGENVVTVALHVGWDVIAGLVGIVGQANNGDRARISGGMAQHGADDFWLVHLYLFPEISLLVPGA